jgi:acyl-CoA reductase-like NAD-dependent aldehyde dehydrogenase
MVLVLRVARREDGFNALPFCPSKRSQTTRALPMKDTHALARSRASDAVSVSPRLVKLRALKESQMQEVMCNYINGEWTESSTGEVFEQQNPADLNDVTGRFQRSSRQDAASAIDAASVALDRWSRLPAPKRAEMLRQVVDSAIRQRDSLAQVLTAENGKTLRESLSEIDATVKEMDWQVAEGRRLYGTVVSTETDGTLAYIMRRPLGVVSIIAPWNFPFSVAGRKCLPALMAGNTVVLKPASLTPRTGIRFVQLFDEAGIPPGVINLVTGDGRYVGDELVAHRKVKAISFTGSTPVGRAIHRRAAENLARTQLEMGGKNPIVVLDDADIVAAADAAVYAAFANAGQWCTSTSRAVVDAKVHEQFVELVAERARAIRVGNGLDPQTDMGPVCGEQQRDDVLEYIEIGQAEGAKIIVGGRQLTHNGLERGCFIEATVLGGVTPDMRIAREEIFGPVLSILRVNDFEEAIRVANAVDFGLSSSVYTRSLEKALTFVENTDVGLTHVNLPTALKEPQLEFGGVKDSGVGSPEAGRAGLEFFTEHRVAYIRYR